MKIFSFISGMVTGVIVMLFVGIVAMAAHISRIEDNDAMIEALGDAADFAAYYHDSGDEAAMDSCLSKREHAYNLGYHGWY